MKTLEKLNIAIPALPRPTLEELQNEWNWIARIEKDDSPETEVALEIGTVLKDGESRIGGREYGKRRPAARLGCQHAKWLVEHQDEFPGFAALLGKIYIDFPGLVVVHEDDDREVPYLNGVGGRWELRWDWADDVLGPDGRVASFRKSAKPSDAGTPGRKPSAPRSLGSFESRLSKVEKTLEKIREALK